MLKTKLHIFSRLLSIAFLLFSACEKHEDHPVPKVPVSFQIDLLADPEFIRLAAPGNSQEIHASTLGLFNLGYGNNGLVIYNEGSGDFAVYDLTCPYDMPRSIAIETESTSVIGICPECGTNYILSSWGSPDVKGPGIWPLQSYRSFYNTNNGILQVSN